jgi:DNA mismatch endonuclease, patch repair protein
MQGNRPKDTKPEMKLRRALWGAGARGYRVHVSTLPGSPDLVFKGKMLVVRVHGCYWHRCPQCRKDAVFHTNEAFWRAKLDANVQRDAANEQALRQLGYRVLTLWECQINTSLPSCVQDILKLLGNYAEGPA